MFDPGLYARRVEILLSQNRFDSARAAIDEAEKEALAARRGLTVDEKLDLPLADTDLPLRAVNALDERGIIRVRDLVETPRAALEAMPRFGLNTLEQIQDLLDSLGISKTTA